MSSWSASKAPADLVGDVDGDAQLLSPGPDQGRVLLEHTANNCNVDFLLTPGLLALTADNGLCLLTSKDRADSSDLQGAVGAKGLLDSLGEGDLVTRAGGDLLHWAETGRGDIDQVNATLLKDLGKLNGVVDRPALALVLMVGVEPVAGGDTEEQRHVLGDDGAGNVNDLKTETNAVLKGATILVSAVVGGGGDEAVQEVAVGVVDLDGVEASGERALGGSSPSGLEVLDVLEGHLLGVAEAVAVWDGAGGLDVVGPAVDVLSSDCAHGDPGGNGGGLATSVGKLDTDLLVLRVGEVNDLLHGLDLAVLPETAVLGCDTSLRDNGLDPISTLVGPMRGGEQTVASTMANPGPLEMIPPRWAMCHAVWCPFSAEYWQRGLSMILFCMVKPLSFNGVYSLGMGLLSGWGSNAVPLGMVCSGVK